MTGAAATLALAVASALATAAGAQTSAPVIYTMEELVTGPISAELLQRMVPLHTLQEVEGLLKANRIPFAWRIAELSTDKVSPATARQIAALPPKEVFVTPSANGVMIGVIIAQR